MKFRVRRGRARSGGSVAARRRSHERDALQIRIAETPPRTMSGVLIKLKLDARLHGYRAAGWGGRTGGDDCSRIIAGHRRGLHREAHMTACPSSNFEGLDKLNIAFDATGGRVARRPRIGHLVDWLIHDGWGQLVLVVAGAAWVARQIWIGQLGR